MTIRPLIALLLVALPATVRAQQQTRSLDPSYRDPGTATLYSVAIPGGGQFYSGETTRGLMLLGGSSAAILVGRALSTQASCDYDASSPYGLSCKSGNNTPLTVGALAALGIWGYGIIDAKHSAERQNLKHSQRTAKRVDLEPLVSADIRAVNMGVHVTF